MPGRIEEKWEVDTGVISVEFTRSSLSVLYLKAPCRSERTRPAAWLINKTPGSLLHSRTVQKVREIDRVREYGNSKKTSQSWSTDEISIRTSCWRPICFTHAHTHIRTYKLPATPIHKSLWIIKIVDNHLQRIWQISLSIRQVRLCAFPLNSWTLKWSSSSVMGRGWEDGGRQKGETSVWGVRHHKLVLWLNQCCHNPLVSFIFCTHSNPRKVRRFEHVHEKLMGFQ